MFNINLTTTILSCILIFSSHLNIESSNHFIVGQNLQNSTICSEQSIQYTLNRGNSSSIQGIYQCITEDQREEHEMAIIRNQDNDYIAIFLNGASNYMDWEKGEELGFIPNESKFETPYFFNNLQWVLSDKKINTSTNISFPQKNKLVLSFDNLPELLISYEKKALLPPNTKAIHYNSSLMNVMDEIKNTIEDLQENMRYVPEGMRRVKVSYGSSFVLSTDGYIVTNHHVIKDATNFRVIKYQSTDSVLYKAQLIYSNLQNDIAILKIEDANFENFDKIPYSIATKHADQGEEIFTLGYPLCEKLGKETKLEKGIIKSLYGFKDDPKAYSTSINLLQGNSGGPLFGTSGELEGIVNARFSGANDMSYAIKSQILVKILQKLSIPIPNQSSIAGLTFTEQVKKLTPFAFRIAAYK
ncbi:MAG: S1C family serine protease [Chitinophagales bacterium]